MNFGQTRASLQSHFSRVQPFATLQTVACQAPLSMGLSRQEYWSGFPSPSIGDLPDPGIEPGFPALQAGSLLSEPPGKPYLGRDPCQTETLNNQFFQFTG